MKKEVVVMKMFPRLGFKNFNLEVYSARTAMNLEMTYRFQREGGATYVNTKIVQAKMEGNE